MIDDIKAYLYVFAKNLGHDLSENNDNLNDIAKQIEQRVINHSNFEQISSFACKKCIMKYEERGNITKKKYEFCISSGEFNIRIPINCPKFGKKQEVFDNNEDNIIEDIRKRGK